MRAVIQDISEITDSRELLESKPNPVIPVFIYSLIVMLLIAIVWSYFGEIDESIKAQGVIRPNDKISTIKNIVAGKVESIYMQEGMKVKKGDALITIEHNTLNAQKDMLQSQYSTTMQQLENLEKFKQSIVDGKNYFNPNIDSEKGYYNRYLKYQTDMELQSKQAETDLNNADELSKTLQGLELLKQSIQQGKNLFNDADNIYSRQYRDYQFNIQNLKNVLDQKSDSYNTIRELAISGAVSQKDLDDAKKLLDSAEVDLQKYENSFMLDIDTKINDNEKSIKQLEITLNTYSQGIGTGQNGTDLNLEKYKMDTLVQTNTDIQAANDELDKLENDLETATANCNDCVVKSPIDGIVNIAKEINVGDLLQAGDQAASIVPDNNNIYKVQLYASNADIASIKVGEKIKYHIQALPYREYGELTGTITKIGTDATVDQASGTSYYLVESSIENKPLYSYKGVKAQIKVGMSCEAQVVTSTKKIMHYLLEKINLRD